ncbi:MAG: phosphatidylserine decarboxylase family protein [Bacteroidota bacterium]
MALKLHKEGSKTIPLSLIIISVLISLGFWIHDVLGIIFLILGSILSFLVFNFFRNPHIPIEQHEDHVLSPCDGKVVVIEEIHEPLYFKKPMIQVSVFMSPLNIHVNRNPIAGKLQFFRYLPGKYLMAFNPKSSTDNEQTFLVASNNQITIGYKQIAGFLARRIRWYVDQGDELKQGAEFGFIRYGSRVDLLLPTDCKIEVQLDQVVKGGQTVIASVG